LVLGFAFQVMTMAALRIARLLRWRTAEKIIYLTLADGGPGAFFYWWHFEELYQIECMGRVQTEKTLPN